MIQAHIALSLHQFGRQHLPQFGEGETRKEAGVQERQLGVRHLLRRGVQVGRGMRYGASAAQERMLGVERAERGERVGAQVELM